MENRAKQLLSGLVCLVLCLVLVLPATAATPGAAWATVQDQQAIVYLRGANATDPTECQIGSTPVTPARIQAISALETPVHTVMVVDNSISIPKSERPLVKEILENVAGNRLPGEQFTVATISETVTYLCEAQSDYLQVKAALDSIAYNDQQTRLTDCLYQILTHLQQQYSGQFCRIILVADGVDNQQIGYTREELDTLLKQTGYPLYAVGCTNTSSNGNQELQNLFALSRLTSGSSFYLAETQDANAIAAGMADWNTGVQMVFRLPDDLCDGSTRQMQILSGENSYTVALTMPFGTLPATPAPSAAPATATPVPATGETAREEEGGFRLSLPLLILIGCGVLVGIGIVVIIIVAVVSSRSRQAPPLPQPPAVRPLDPTVIQPETEIDDSVVNVWGDNSGALTLKLTDQNDPRHMYSHKLTPGRVLSVGRDPACQVLIDFEPSVARHQCDIYLKGDEVWVRNQSHSNITHVNGQRIDGECPLSSGCTLKMGRLLMKVEYKR